MVDPVQLAIRVARRYGKRSRFGKWEKVVKGMHIPLTAFDSRKVESVAVREMRVEAKLTRSVYRGMFTKANMRVEELLPTQPFVRTENVETLRMKIGETKPTHIRVVTHKGKHYIDDGHHAVMAAKLRGDETVEVSYLNLDQFPKR
jgi:hypothetical protein